MRPDLRNVVIEVEDERNSQRRVAAHHRAFPELGAEGQSPTEGLLALLGLLKRSSTSVMDDGNSPELAYAVFDVESLLKVMVSSDRLRICGYGSVITKTNDLIYFSHNMTEDDQTGLVRGTLKGPKRVRSKTTRSSSIRWAAGLEIGGGRNPVSGHGRARPNDAGMSDGRWIDASTIGSS